MPWHQNTDRLHRWNQTHIEPTCLSLCFLTGLHHCDSSDSNSRPQRLLPVLDRPEQGETPHQLKCFGLAEQHSLRL